MILKGLLRMVPRLRVGLALRFAATKSGAMADKKSVVEHKKADKERATEIDKTIRNLSELVGMKVQLIYYHSTIPAMMEYISKEMI